MPPGLIALLLALRIVATPVVATSYGIDDEFSWQRHASSWHAQTPAGAPETVDEEYYGAASNDLPFGTIVRVTILTECNGDPLGSRRTVTVTVVDRLANGLSGYVDLWPAPAKEVGLGKDGCALGVIN